MVHVNQPPWREAQAPFGSIKATGSARRRWRRRARTSSRNLKTVFLDYTGSRTTNIY